MGKPKKISKVPKVPKTDEEIIREKINKAIDRNLRGTGIASIQAAKMLREQLNENKTIKSNSVFKIKWVNIESTEDGKLIEEPVAEPIPQAVPIIEKKAIDGSSKHTSAHN